MNSRIYSIEYRDPMSAETFHSLLSVLPAYMADKVLRYHRWQDAYGSLFGKLLLMTALAAYGYPAHLKNLRYSEYGRPYLPDGPDFNISHSGFRTVCIIARQGKVGIDLEEIRNIDIEDFKEQFSPEEWGAIITSTTPLNTFYHYWTAKECLSKADGRGLNLPLAGIPISHDGLLRLDHRNWSLRTLHSFPGFACHIAADDVVFDATDGALFDPALITLTINELKSAAYNTH